MRVWHDLGMTLLKWHQLIGWLAIVGGGVLFGVLVLQVLGLGVPPDRTDVLAQALRCLAVVGMGAGMVRIHQRRIAALLFMGASILLLSTMGLSARR